jgi:diguanylate cyclase (GGDEF)-like protein
MATMKPRLTSIRFQLVIVTVGVSLLVALLFVPYAQRRIELGFDRFENDYLAQEQRRFDLLLRAQADALERTAIDYSRWDDTVEFLAGRKPQWIDENLTQDVFENFHVAMIAIADRELTLSGVRVADGSPIPEDLGAMLRDRGTCTAAIGAAEARHRFESRDGRPHLVVCSPVLATEPDDAPVVGVMLWLLELDQDRIDAIRALLQFPFELAPPAPGAASEPRFGADTITVTRPVRDWDGHAGLRATITVPRPLGAQRELTTRLMLVLLLAAVAIPPLLMLVFLELYVVRRIRGVSAGVRAAHLGEAGTLQGAMLPPGTNAGFAELEMLTHDYADLTQRLETARAQWQSEAMHDSLTALGNRPRLLADMAPMLQRTDVPVVLLLIDLDGFKAVNDMLGHPAGDVLLRDVALILLDVARPGVGTYRLGGDEFAMLAPGLDAASVERLAREICDKVRLVRHASGKPMSVTTCVGVGVSAAGESLTMSQLLAQADMALYEAKRSGRGIHRIFSAATHAGYREQLELESELATAIAEDRLVAWFQPIVDARSGVPIAVEALARWHEPQRGWIPPSRFIPIAEHTGQIRELDSAIINYSMRAFGAMRARRPTLKLHVNLSVRTLTDEAFLPALDAMLAATGIAHEALWVELTETDLSTEPHQLERALARLRERGLQLVVDDFGVGASSLGRLAQVQPGAVKIDGSFVRDIHGDGGRICRAIIELARELGMASVAEYVERDEHTRALVDMGCDALQGYGISPPLAQAQMLEWLDQAPRGNPAAATGAHGD